MQLPYERRPAPAQTLSRRMAEREISTKRLANEAGVTELHVTYLRSFATEMRQIMHVMDVLESMRYNIEKRPRSTRNQWPIHVDVAEETHEALIEKADGGSVSSVIQSFVEDAL